MGRVTFSTMRKSPKNRRGTPQGRTSFAMSAYPRTPITRVTPWVRQNSPGAQNLSGVSNSRRATGPWPCKNFRCCGPAPAPGVAELVAAGTWSAGGPRTSPTKFRKSFLRIVGEGLAPPAMPSPEGRSPSAHTACFLFLSVGAHIVRPRAAEVTGPYGVYRTASCMFVGAVVLPHPFPLARPLWPPFLLHTSQPT